MQRASGSAVCWANLMSCLQQALAILVGSDISCPFKIVVWFGRKWALIPISSHKKNVCWFRLWTPLHFSTPLFVWSLCSAIYLIKYRKRSYNMLIDCTCFRESIERITNLVWKNLCFAAVCRIGSNFFSPSKQEPRGISPTNLISIFAGKSVTYIFGR